MLISTAPMACLLLDHASGHNHVRMGILFKFTIMGMESAMDANSAFELRVAGERRGCNDDSGVDPQAIGPRDSLLSEQKVRVQQPAQHGSVGLE